MYRSVRSVLPLPLGVHVLLQFTVSAYASPLFPAASAASSAFSCFASSSAAAAAAAAATAAAATDAHAAAVGWC